MTPIPRAERLIVALDVATPNEAKALVERLGDAARFYKLGLELFMAGGRLSLLPTLVEGGDKGLVGLNFFDGPGGGSEVGRVGEGRRYTWSAAHLKKKNKRCYNVLT